MQEITLGGSTRKVYTPLYGTVAYLVEQIEQMVKVEKELPINITPGVSQDYVKGYREALQDVLKLAKEVGE